MYIRITILSISCCAILKFILISVSFVGLIGFGYGLTSFISCPVGVIVGVNVAVLTGVFVDVGVDVLVYVGVDVLV